MTNICFCSLSNIPISSSSTSPHVTIFHARPYSRFLAIKNILKKRKKPHIKNEDSNFVGGSFSKSSHPDVFLVKGVLKTCTKFTGEHLCWSVISIKLLCNFIEITLCNFIEVTLQHGCSPVHMQHIFRTPFYKNADGELLLHFLLLCVKMVRHTLKDYIIFFRDF